MGCGMGCGLWAVGCGLSAVGFGLWAVGCGMGWDGMGPAGSGQARGSGKIEEWTESRITKLKGCF